MLSKNDFVEYVLGLRATPVADAGLAAALPGDFDDFDDFDDDGDAQALAPDPSDFARGLLERCFGDAPEMPVGDILVPRDDADQRRLDTHYAAGAHYWRKTASRPFHVVLVRLKRRGSEVVNGAHRRTVRELRLIEDVLHRHLQDGLVWFERGGPRRTTEMPQGSQTETLYVVSITDDRPDGEARQLVCFGTKATETGALESYFLREEVLDWDPALAREHLDSFYSRHLDPLGQGEKWQNAFVTGAERKKARKLIDECSKLLPDRGQLEHATRELLDEIAGSFGLRRKGGRKGHRLVLHKLPENHSIAVEPAVARDEDFKNDFQGVRIFDAGDKLLGYILYVVNGPGQAAELREQLEQNHFHNVLVVYPDQQDTRFELWQGATPLQGSLRGDKRASQFNGEGGVVQLLSRFFIVSRTEIQESNKLARELAWRAQHLRALALDELEKEAGRPSGQRPLQDLLDVFNQALASMDEEAFADAYAQTITYGLLAARWMSAERDDLHFARKNVTALLPNSPFLHDLFDRLMDNRFDKNLLWLVDDVTSLLGRTSVRSISFRTNDPSIHFYEDFLDEYDKAIRAERGVYYTPDEVVSYIVRTSHTALQERFGLRLGLADTTPWSEFASARDIEVPKGIDPSEPFVQILDPACGTGTFPLHAIRVIHETMMAEYAAQGLTEEQSLKAWNDYVPAHLLPRLNAFELMMAPYIVSHLRLGLALQQTGFVFGKGDRLRVYLTNTLEMHTAPQLALIGEHVADEAAEAEKLKKQAPISVVIGNPPYDRHDAADTAAGGWVRRGDSVWHDGKPLLDDYTEPVTAAGGGLDLKNIYNLYVYFWRWAAWRVFEMGPRAGVVAMITPSSFLRGKAFLGMRARLRSTTSKLFLLDLEGDQRGTRKTENVFKIKTPVVVCTALRPGGERESGSSVGGYTRVIGSSDEKLEQCNQIRSLSDVDWDPLFEGATAPLMGVSENEIVDYSTLPRLTDLFPWTHTGSEFQRTWPIAETRELLLARWRCFLASPDRATAFSENRDRKVAKAYKPLLPGDPQRPPLQSEPLGAPAPAVKRFGFRSFQRFWCFADNRIGTVLKAQLWWTEAGDQLFLTSLLTGVLGDGPAATITPYVPDKHHYRGSYGGRDVIPLWRDPSATAPNLAGGVLPMLQTKFGATPSPIDFFAYTYAVLANPGYVRRFKEELQVPGPRLPVTKDAELFRQGATLGRQLVRWHTYGERFTEGCEKFEIKGSAREVNAIPRTPAGYPKKHSYDASTQTLHVGGGQIRPVAPEIMDFSVSGLMVVKSWLDYRMKKGAGRKSSPLDHIRPERWTDTLTQELLELLWVLEWTLAQYPALDAWLDKVLESELFTTDEIPPPTDAEIKPPKVKRTKQRSLL